MFFIGDTYCGKRIRCDFDSEISIIESKYLKDEYLHGVINSVIRNCNAQFHYKLLMKDL